VISLAAEHLWLFGGYKKPVRAKSTEQTGQGEMAVSAEADGSRLENAKPCLA
jgi:hypothetical protein